MAAVASAWKQKDVAEWGNPEVRAFLEAALPGHPCATAAGSGLRHATGRVLGSLSKEELRRQVRDEEATNVIWAELRRLKEQREESEAIRSQGGTEPFALFVRTPADISVELTVQAADTVADVKARIAAAEGTPVEMQRLTRNGAPLLDTRTLASYSISHGTMLLLVPRLSVGGQRYTAGPAGLTSAGGLRNGGASSAAGAPSAAAAAAAGPRGAGGASSGIPRPRVPVACADIARPFPMSLEFEGIGEYQSFMLALQRQAGRRDTSAAAASGAAEDAPFLEILPADNLREPVQTRISFDTAAEILHIDTAGDVLMECARYKVLLHLRADQKPALLVTGIRLER